LCQRRSDVRRQDSDELRPRGRLSGRRGMSITTGGVRRVQVLSRGLF
jgi:hypothetical protein